MPPLTHAHNNNRQALQTNIFISGLNANLNLDSRRGKSSNKTSFLQPLNYEMNANGKVNVLKSQNKELLPGKNPTT